MTIDPTVLVHIKDLREQRALRELRQARDAQKRAQDALDQCQKELADYQVWRPQRERALYDEVHEKAVKRRDLDDLKVEIIKLREQELELIDQVTASEKTLDEAKTERLAAEQRYKEACAGKQKIEHLATEWREREALRMERLSDLEMEDFHRVRNPTL
ncbi:MAG: YscO family type III secretion system apparatus protein [Pseudomonadota bacterium]